MGFDQPRKKKENQALGGRKKQKGGVGGGKTIRENGEHGIRKRRGQ